MRKVSMPRNAGRLLSGALPILNEANRVPNGVICSAFYMKKTTTTSFENRDEEIYQVVAPALALN